MLYKSNTNYFFNGVGHLNIEQPNPIAENHLFLPYPIAYLCPQLPWRRWPPLFSSLKPTFFPTLRFTVPIRHPHHPRLAYRCLAHNPLSPLCLFLLDFEEPVGFLPSLKMKGMLSCRSRIWWTRRGLLEKELVLQMRRSAGYGPVSSTFATFQGAMTFLTYWSYSNHMELFNR